MEHPNLKELKENDKNWEVWTDYKIYQRHFCKDPISLNNLTNDDAGIFLASWESNPCIWLYAHVWLADEQEIYDGEAKEIGEVMSSSDFRIYYCPFCGEKLDT